MHYNPFISTDRNSHGDSYRPSGSAEVFTSSENVCLLAGDDDQSTDMSGIGVLKVSRTHN